MVVAIIAILTTLAAPSFKQLIQSNTMSSNVNSFLADMRFSRSEALRRGGVVVMCRSNSPEGSAPACDGSASTGWVSGWIIFHDLNNDGIKDSGEAVLRVQGPITSMDSIVDMDGTPEYMFPFTATGRLIPTFATTLKFGGGNYTNLEQRVVCVTLGGHARIAGNGDATCP